MSPASVISRVNSTPLHIQLRQARWIAPLVVLGLAAIHQLGEHTISHLFAPQWQELIELLLYSFTGSVVTWIGLTWLANAVSKRAEAEMKMQTAFQELETNHQKLLALQDLGGDVSAADDEEAVLELAAQAPLKLTGARASTVFTFDDNREVLNLDMAWGLSENYLGALRHRVNEGIPAGRCRTCLPLRTKASSDCPLFVGLDEHARTEGIGSLVCLPISHERERVGIISAYFASPEGPTEDQVRLLNILGGTIAGALYSLRSRTRQVNTLHEIDRAAHATQALDELAQKLLDVTIAGWQAQAGALFLCDAQTDTWTTHAQRGMGSDLASPRFNVAWEMVHQAYENETLTLRSELNTDLLSAIAVPLVSDGQAFGAIFLGGKRRRMFSEQHSELLMTMAHQIALAIRNAQLYLKVEQLAVLEERYRLSREIHDGLAQTLAYLGLQVERLEGLMSAQRYSAVSTELGEMHQSLRAAYVDAREAIDGLRLSVDEPATLAGKLSEYCSEFSRQTGMQVVFTSEPENISTSPTVLIQLLRITQEALTNVRKHANAKQVQVRLIQNDTHLELTVTDDGRGFSESTTNRVHKSHGLASMRERAQSIGGKFTIATSAAQGTRLAITIPNSIL